MQSNFNTFVKIAEKVNVNRGFTTERKVVSSLGGEKKELISFDVSGIWELKPFDFCQVKLTSAAINLPKNGAQNISNKYTNPNGSIVSR
jgi:hypothetical protein